jgi:prepilin-type N-terminal cleavage/methylation domain-containing protein
MLNINNIGPAPKAVGGFSLIELMVSVLIGLIVAAGAVSLIVAIDQANSETIQSTRLTQELRSLASVIADELKRSNRVNDPIAEVGQGLAVDCPATAPKTPAQPCYTFSTASGRGASACVTYGYTGTLSSTTSYNYRSIRRVVAGTIGTIVLDQNAGIDGATAGTTILTAAQAATCPVTGSTAYTLSSNEVDITSLCFSSSSDGNTCFFDTTDSTCKLNTTVTVTPAPNEIDVCITGTLRAGDIYTKTITRAFIQPVYVRSNTI